MREGSLVITDDLLTCSTGLLNRSVQRHGPPFRVKEQDHSF